MSGVPRVLRGASAAMLLTLAAAGFAPNAHGADEWAPQVDQMRALLHAQKLDDAVALGEAWTKASPKSSLAWHWAGRAYAQHAIKSSFFTAPTWASKTRDAFQKAVALDDKNIDAHFDLLQFYLQAPSIMGGGIDKASAEAAAIGKVDPARGHIALGAVAESSEDAKTAEREYRAAYAALPDEARAQVSLVNLYSKQKRWSDARAVLNEALARKPDEPRTLYQLGKLAAISGEDLAHGLQCLDRFLAKKEFPDELPEFGAHWRKAQVLEHMGHKDEAIAELRLAVKLDPTAEAPQKDLKRLAG